ncbi:MAG TPA: shikimate kinase [Oscillospiraceae bacterium]|nr:shikimate kinase [Oscillospiraceae bacterium]
MKDGDSLEMLPDNKFGVVGQSLAYSYESFVHSLIGDYNYKVHEVSTNEFSSLLKNNDFKALTILSPYKKIAYDLSTAVAASALKSRFANLVTKDKDGTLKAYNTDYDAFNLLLSKHSVDVTDKKVLILGTGGVANAAKVALNEAGAAKVVFVSRHGQNNYDNISIHYDSDILINATPVGRYPHNGHSPIELDGFSKLFLVIDFVYNPVRTALIQQAMERSIRVISGSYMLAAGAASSARVFLEEPFEADFIDSVKKKILSEKMNITLIGMPGSGKASIGQALSQTIQRPFIDLDVEVEKMENMSVADIFSTRGEGYFREAEKNVALKYCKQSGNIISTGGGAILSKENRIAIKENSFVVYVERNFLDLYNDGRTTPTSIENLQRIYEVRTPIYELLADTVIRAHGSVDANVNMVLEAFKNANHNY